MAAQGTQLTNKYAEGYPGKRYYGGCEFVDVGRAAGHRPRRRARSAPNTPTCSPTPARRPTRACSSGLLQPGDTIMGMSLAEGGHLTHGMPLNMSGKWFKVVSYGLDAEEAIDYDAMERIAHEHKPKLIIAGRLGLQPAHRLRALREGRQGRSARTSWSTWPTTPASIAAGVYPNPVPLRRRRHLDDAQEPARPARRLHPDEGRRREGHQQRDLPGHPGRPADARHRRPRRWPSRRRWQPEFKDLPAAGA